MRYGKVKCMKDDILFNVQDLQIWSDEEHKFLLKNINFSIVKNKVLGMIGESGSGKTLIAKSILGLNDVYPGIINGKIEYFIKTNNDSNNINNKNNSKQLISVTENIEQKYKGILNHCTVQVADHNNKDIKIFKINADKLKVDLSQSFDENADKFYGELVSMIFQDPKTYIYPYLSVKELLERIYQRAVKVHEVDVYNITIPINGKKAESVQYCCDSFVTDYVLLSDLNEQHFKPGHFPMLDLEHHIAVLLYQEGDNYKVHIHGHYKHLDNGILRIKCSEGSVLQLKLFIDPNIHDVTTKTMKETGIYKVFIPLNKLIEQEVDQILNKVNLNDSEIKENRANRISGGQGQRLMISLCLALKSDLIIADEPTTGLDVSAQAALIQFLNNQVARNKTLLLISHDLYLMNHLANNLVVVYRGEVLEYRPFDCLNIRVAKNEVVICHPYTRALFEIANKELFSSLNDTEDDYINDECYSGCVFYTKCESKSKSDICKNESPPYICATDRRVLKQNEISSCNHFIRCWGILENYAVSN
ncbi:MAG: ABC transporter ATP-binding protein [Bacteroidales bacterium]|nr:ABC transporter ATP-binding protein [Bacteroidales bacterium]